MSEAFNLSEYMNVSIEKLVKNALKASLKNPRESTFLLSYSIKAKGAAAKRKQQHENEKIHIPPFLIASIATTCNLFCKGCYARANKSCTDKISDNQLSAKRWNEIFEEAAQLGVSFILLAGGEPFMRKDVIETAAGYKSIIFPVFTNGTMFDQGYFELFNNNRNLLPILSLEGDQTLTDTRRGSGTYDTLMNNMEYLNNKGIFYGASVTVTTQNLDMVTNMDFVNNLYNKGCKLIFYVEYVPVTKATEYLAPEQKDRELLDEKLQILRNELNDMIFLAFPGDEKGTGGCLAAGRGFFHINANGGAEPCPFSPFSDINLGSNSLLQALQSPLFMKIRQDGKLQGEHKGGCLLFENEAYVSSLVE